jgi:hypothetical protein
VLGDSDLIVRSWFVVLESFGEFVGVVEEVLYGSGRHVTSRTSGVLAWHEQ